MTLGVTGREARGGFASARRWTGVAASVVVTATMYLWWRSTATLHGANPALAGLLLAADVWGVVLVGAWLARVRPTTLTVPPARGALVADVVITAGAANADALERTLIAVRAVRQRGEVVVIGRQVAGELVDVCQSHGVRYRADGGATSADSFLRAGASLPSPLTLWIDAGQVPRADIIRAAGAWFEQDVRLATLQVGEQLLHADSFAVMRRVGDESEVDQRVALPALGSRGCAPWTGPGSIVRRESFASLVTVHEGDPCATERIATQLHRSGWRTGHDPRRLLRVVAPDTLGDYLGYRRRRALSAYRFVLSKDGPLRASGAPLPWRLACLASAIQYTASLRSVLLVCILGATLASGSLPLTASPWAAVGFALPYGLVSLLARPMTSGGVLRPGEWSRLTWRNLAGDLAAMAAATGVRPVRFVRRSERRGAAAIGQLRALSVLVVALDAVVLLRAATLVRPTLLRPTLLRPMPTLARVATLAVSIATIVPMVDVLQLVMRRRQRRTTNRYACHPPVHLDGLPDRVQTFDLSVKGIGIDCPIPLTVGMHCRINLDIPLVSDGRDITMSAIVRAATPHGSRYRIGLEFVEVEAHSRQALIAYCIALGEQSPAGGAAIERPSDLGTALHGRRRRGVRALTIASVALGGIVMVAGPSAASNDPTAVDDSYGVYVGQTLNIGGLGVLGNDSADSGASLSADVVSGPSNGYLSFNADGSFSYSSYSSSATSDSFTYEFSDGNSTSNTATVHLSVADPPSASDDSVSGYTGTSVSIDAPGVLANDSDQLGAPLSASLVSSPSYGYLAFNSDGSFTYYPYGSGVVNDSFTYQVSNGTLTGNTATVSITISSAAYAADDYFSGAAGQSLSVSSPGVLGNDSDAVGASLSASVVSSPSNGYLSFNGDGSFTYYPYSGSPMTDSFVYQVSDGYSTGNTATVTLDLSSSTPSANDDSYSMYLGQTLYVSAPGVLGNDSNPLGNGLSATVTSGPSYGSLSLNADGSFAYYPYWSWVTSDTFTYQASNGSSSSNNATVTINISSSSPSANDDSYSMYSGQSLSVSAPGVVGNDSSPAGGPLSASVTSGPSSGYLSFNSDGSFSYYPYSGSPMTDSFTYQVSDGYSTSNSATVTISVASAASAGDDSFNVTVGQWFSVSAPGVLGNDSDALGAGLSASLLSSPNNGYLSFNSDGSFSYYPYSGSPTTDSFTYQVSDGYSTSNAATVILNVVNPPFAADDSYGVYVGQSLSVSAPGVLGNDTDNRGSGLTATLVSGPSNGSLSFNTDGSFSYSSSSGSPTTDSFTYQVSDGNSTSNTATVSVTVAGSPVAADDTYDVFAGESLSVSGPGVLVNDTDGLGAALTATLISGPSSGTFTLNTDGSFTYAPQVGGPYTDSFTYQVSNGVESSNTATATINVLSAATAVDDHYGIYIGQTLTVSGPGVLGNDTDGLGTGLTATLVTGPADGTLTFNTDGSFTYTPQVSAPTTDSFTYQVFDGYSTSNTVTVTLTVAGPPTSNDDTYTVAIGDSLAVAAPGVLGNDTDGLGANLTATLITSPTNGTLTLNTDGSFTYTPLATSPTTDSFTYQASNGVDASNAATVNLTIIAVPPTTTTTVPPTTTATVPPTTTTTVPPTTTATVPPTTTATVPPTTTATVPPTTTTTVPPTTTTTVPPTTTTTVPPTTTTVPTTTTTVPPTTTATVPPTTTTTVPAVRSSVTAAPTVHNGSTTTVAPTPTGQPSARDRPAAVPPSKFVLPRSTTTSPPASVAPMTVPTTSPQPTIGGDEATAPSAGVFGADIASSRRADSGATTAATAALLVMAVGTLWFTSRRKRTR